MPNRDAAQLRTWSRKEYSALDLEEAMRFGVETVGLILLLGETTSLLDRRTFDALQRDVTAENMRTLKARVDDALALMSGVYANILFARELEQRLRDGLEIFKAAAKSYLSG